MENNKFPDMDVYCQIVDNYGDIGFTKLFVKSYQKRHPEANVRLFVDGVPEAPAVSAPLVVETFGCDIPEAHMFAIKRDAHRWVNVEYLTAEEWAYSCHGKESPQNGGPRKYFFMPGFSSKTGGVITDFNATKENKRVISIFTYAQDFSTLFEACKDEDKIEFLVFDKYSQAILSDKKPDCCEKHQFTMSPFVTADEYDQILASSMVNLVRGEVSFIRAILAGKPFLWQAYKQNNDLHLVKVEAFLNVFKEYWTDKVLYDEYHKLMMAWNGNGESISVDNWRVFLENLASIEEYTQHFGDYLRSECDMGVNFDEFIKQIW